MLVSELFAKISSALRVSYQSKLFEGGTEAAYGLKIGLILIPMFYPQYRKIFSSG